MNRVGGAASWAITVGVAMLFAFVLVPAFSSAAGATGAGSLAPSGGAPMWAYGGEGWSNNTLISGNLTLEWNAMFGWTVVFTATPMGNGVTMVEEVRTVGMTIGQKAFSPQGSYVFHSHAQEVDTAFANLTNQSTVYVGGQPVPALGILNASASVAAEINQSISETVGGATRSAAFQATGSATAFIPFTPSLGLIPLNLTGVSQWNSTAIANPSASWNISWSWMTQSYNGTTHSGSNSSTGSLSGSATVNVTGYRVALDHPFADHVVRVGVLLVVQGPFDSYDGFVLIPHHFDLFGSAFQDYSSVELESDAISAERLYVNEGTFGPTVSAADTTFAASLVGGTGGALAVTGAPSATSGPGATVAGQPMSVSQAQSEAQTLTQPGGGGSSASLAIGGAVFLGVIAVAAALGAFGVIEWRAYARRRQQHSLVGGYGEAWQNGVPPPAAAPPAAQTPSSQAPGPGAATDLTRRRP